jgi:predicted dehydrogenase
MVRGTELFFAELLKHDLPVTNCLASDFTRLPGRLARHDGISGVDGFEFRRTPLPPDSHRGGVLTIASVLKVTANGTTTSPVLRGAWGLDRFLDQPPEPPSETVAALEPDTHGAPTSCKQLTRHRQLEACAVCHAVIDAYGFTLECFDVIGGWRDRYRTTGWDQHVEAVHIDGRQMSYHVGHKIEPSDKLSNGRESQNVDELQQLLLADEHQFARALTIKLLTSATGAAPTGADQPQIDAIVAKCREKSYGFRSLIHVIVASELFHRKSIVMRCDLGASVVKSLTTETPRAQRPVSQRGSGMRFRFAMLIALSVIAVSDTHQASAADLIKIGILGIDNYGSVAYTEFLNKPRAEGVFEGMRVVAAYDVASPDYPDSAKLGAMWKAQLSKMYQNPKDPRDAVPPIEWVDSIDALLAKVDCVMIFSLDARLHRQQAEPVLRAGKKLFIGRPLASTPEDAVAILKLAAETKTPCWSSSQHRYSTGFAGMVNHPEVGRVIGCDVYGGWDAKAHPADQFWRPLHSIETLYTIMGGPGVVSVTCTSTPTAECITATWKDGRVGTYRGIKEGAVKYSATVFGDKGVSVSGIYGHGVPVKGVVPTNDKYVGYEPLAAEIAKFFKTGVVPVQPAETLEIFALMQAAEESKAQGGAVVKLKNLWQPQ